MFRLKYSYNHFLLIILILAVSTQNLIKVVGDVLNKIKKLLKPNLVFLQISNSINAFNAP